MKKYPFVKMSFWRGDTEEIIAKVSAEMRANNLVADLSRAPALANSRSVRNLRIPTLRR